MGRRTFGLLSNSLVINVIVLFLFVSFLISVLVSPHGWTEGTTLCFNDGVPCPVDDIEQESLIESIGGDEPSSCDKNCVSPEGSDGKVSGGSIHEFGYPKDGVYYTNESESFGIRQAIDDHQTRRVVEASAAYMNHIVLANPERYPVDVVAKKCRNQDEFCAYWAKTGQCERNPTYMKIHCSPVCQTCDPQFLLVEDDDNTSSSTTTTSEKRQRRWAKNETDFGVRQLVNGEDTRKIVDAAIDYMNLVVYANPDQYSEEMQTNCRNHDEFCAFWAATGVCKENPAYMNIRCNPVCQSCDKLDYKVRCPIDPNAKDAIKPGELNRIFERIVNDEALYERLNVTILSRPYIKGGTGIYGIPLEDWQFEGPWILSFDSFLSAAETQRMVELGLQQGFERSANVGGVTFDGSLAPVVSNSRTSTNAWCTDTCNEDPVSQAIWERMERVTGISEKNSEHFQIARYEEGQFYDLHHDFIPEELDRPAGARILRFYMFLNDVDDGGELQFPSLDEKFDLTIPPKNGKALLWPCVLNEDPNLPDDRTQLVELPVEKGQKFSGIAWVHMRDFKTPNSLGCS
jgi:prolyl 4-hydroxylase